MTAAEYKALAGKPQKKPPNRKVESASEQMDISQSDQDKALDCITINDKAEYAEYFVKGVEHHFRLKGSDKHFKITVEEIKP